MSAVLPPPPLALAEGQRMGREDFHAAYLAAPAGVRAELVEGIVRMASPVSNAHGECDLWLHHWLAEYMRRTPGTRGAGNATVRIGQHSELQPDALLRLAVAGSRCLRAADGMLTGPPELVAEVAAASERLDLGEKRRIYAAAGVLEYLVVLPLRGEVRRFQWENGELQPWLADGDGILRSDVFPGLWLDPAALLAGDVEALAEVTQRGLASPEHAAFVAQLQERMP